ncbi:DNA methyltransferase [Nocardiopsis exhalans]|uniref:Methyltransferase n=1 Tax=Nocardiopsis exhalans TaxID=163604 RepID=A0ABY5D980_9ACTN|nr:DNA methyltransferase [Nocardiopsis exhalans]USY19707.1 DNA methyltransferase [Nocardiopsis exhalans]
MTVLYESNRATIVLGDATDPDVIDAAPRADLLATDPPYGVRWQSGFRTTQFPELVGDDGALDVPAVLGAWTRRLRAPRHVYVFGYRPDQLAEPMRLGGTTELIWAKEQVGLGNLSIPWGIAHDRIAFGVHVPSAAERGSGKGRLAARLRQHSLLRAPRRSGTKIDHPTEKPISLMAQLVESSSARGELVLDPFAGSGSTLVAAILTGRRAYGVEITPEYAQLAVDRVRQAEVVADAVARFM